LEVSCGNAQRHGRQMRRQGPVFASPADPSVQTPIVRDRTFIQALLRDSPMDYRALFH